MSGWPYSTTTTTTSSSSCSPTSPGSLLYTVLDVVGLVQDWHLEYQNGPLVVVDRCSDFFIIHWMIIMIISRAEDPH